MASHPSKVPGLYSHLVTRLGPFERAFDLGCGEGLFLQQCRKQGRMASGLDLDKEAVSKCRKLGLQASTGDLFSLLRKGPSKPRPDVWTLCHVIEHYPPHRVRHIFKAAKRWLPPGGRLLLVTPNSKNLGIMADSFWRDPTHVRPYPRSLIAEMGLEAGFQVMESGIDPASAPQGIRRLVNLIRCWIFGNYFEGPDAFVILQKPPNSSV